MSLAVASRYANALADVVLKSGGALQPDDALASLQALEELIAGSHELRHVLLSPAVSAEQKHKIMVRICDQMGMHRLVRNLVFVVVRNRRANLFPLIRAAFERVLDERRGFERADVSSAAPLNDTSRAGLEAQLSRLTGKRLRTHYSVNPELVGGVVARIGSTVYDGSVRGQLEALRRKLVLSA